MSSREVVGEERNQRSERFNLLLRRPVLHTRFGEMVCRTMEIDPYVAVPTSLPSLFDFSTKGLCEIESRSCLQVRNSLGHLQPCVHYILTAAPKPVSTML